MCELPGKTEEELARRFIDDPSGNHVFQKTGSFLIKMADVQDKPPLELIIAVPWCRFHPGEVTLDVRTYVDVDSLPEQLRKEVRSYIRKDNS